MIELFIDGASAGSPGRSGAGIFIKNGQQSQKHSIPLGELTNNEAEFEALIHGLTLCLPFKNNIISCKSDSQAVIGAVEKQFIRNKQYAHYLKKITDLTDQYPLFFIKWIPSKENKVADELARKAIHQNK
ncbi:reverse transcriptase-like protein [Jeotgalibacillus campisalis]|uniref:Ribonuclease H n=1 Tax=Jeotgalibacillus campisalis TaxID=220754 RepID=A0A0C2VVL8_9BACL|nr:reverse transcriptase-like protein [Jeotgalibacillus campisalis]KIL48008.1 ribonuclease H [Jeotgalibacillus campisalis]